jgi:hypothetical protein
MLVCLCMCTRVYTHSDVYSYRWTDFDSWRARAGRRRSFKVLLGCTISLVSAKGALKWFGQAARVRPFAQECWKAPPTLPHVSGSWKRY